MLPDSDHYLSSDDTDMEEGQTNYSSTKLLTAENLVAEMDYSLLAVDMQNLLHISRTGVTDEQPSSEQVSRRPSIKMNEMEDIADHKCLFCTSNFTTRDLLSKHMLRIHYKDVLGVLSQYSNTHEYLKCPFCLYKLSEKHRKLFLLHLEKKHSFEFVASIKEHFSSLSVVSSTSESSASSVSQGEAPTKPKLPVPFHLMQGRKVSVCYRPNNTSVRRRLQLYRLSNVEPTNDILYFKENAPSRIKDANLRNFMRKPNALTQYVCGQCQEAFPHYALWLNHIKVRHRGPLRSVQPL